MNFLRFSLNFGSFIICVAYGVLGPFYPRIAESKGISQWTIGVILSIAPITSIPVVFLVTRYMSKIGRKLICLGSLFLCGISMILLCFIFLCPQTEFLIISIISRVLYGIAAGGFWASSYAILITEFKDNVGEVVGEMDAFIGAGMVSGPLFGTCLYMIGGAITIFITVGGVVFVSGFVTFFTLGHLKPYAQHHEKVDTLRLFIKPQIGLTAIIQFIVFDTMCFMAASMALHLSHNGIDQEIIGVLFSVNSVCYAIGGIIFPRLLKFDKRILMIVGLFLTGVSFCLMGPAIFLPNQVDLIIISIPLLGIANSMTYIPSYPYMHESSLAIYGYEDSLHLSDSLSSIMNLAALLGEATGSLGAGILVEFLDYDWSSTCMSIFVLFFTAVFLFSSKVLSEKRSPKISEDKLIYSMDTVI
ncbi:unnamed protein product [Blepharisma stoltei]|uniref:Major facilitator superfamily (MFS) profile domain-containing protein n=1 Tax=Blepharisma stoltei TaxID=1481888 RepID=A0AAU9IBR2_9CILI|nr:unnamed protein product [Blepharisma stoltei]